MKLGLLIDSEGERLRRTVLSPSSGKTLRQSASSFEDCFEERDRFRACCALLILLRGNADVDLSEEERAVAYFLIGFVHCDRRLPEQENICENPFTDLLVGFVFDRALPFFERALVFTVLTSGFVDDVQGSRPSKVVKLATDISEGELPLGYDQMRANLNAAYSAVHARTRTDFAGLGDSTYHTPSPSCRPRFVRPFPPIVAIELPEYKWVSYPASEPIPASGPDLEPLRSMLAGALAQPLLPAQQQEVISLIRASEPGAGEVTPEGVPELVETNPAVAFAFLKRAAGSNRAEAYLAALAGLDMSFHSVEVVNRLISETEIPSEFTNEYISKCISTCQAVADNRELQNRLVRLLCVFLQRLTRNKPAQVADMLLEVQAFCIEFSRVKEAASLFRLLKVFEGATAPGG